VGCSTATADSLSVSIESIQVDRQIAGTAEAECLPPTHGVPIRTTLAATDEPNAEPDGRHPAADGPDQWLWVWRRALGPAPGPTPPRARARARTPARGRG